MRRFGAWFGRLAMAGACLFGAGCGGGGDVPDPDSDSHAAAVDVPSRPVDKGNVEAPSEPASQPEPTAVAVNTPSPEGEKAGPSQVPVAAATAGVSKPEEKAAEADKPADGPPATKGDASGTEELLRMAGTQANTTPPAGGSPPTGPGGSPSPEASPAPGGGAMAPGIPPGGGGNDRRRAMGRGGESGPAMSGGPSEPGGPATKPEEPGGMVPPSGGPGGRPGSPGGPGFGAMAGVPGGPGGGDSANLGPAAFNRPVTAVQAFLAALKAKDKDRLAETVARRAPTEAAEKHRKIFAAIVEGSLSDDEFDEMAKALEGYQVVSMLEARSTGRIGVIVSKMAGRDRLQRTIMTRKEKEGWKVLDVDNALDFKPAGIVRRRR